MNNSTRRVLNVLWDVAHDWNNCRDIAEAIRETDMLGCPAMPVELTRDQLMELEAKLVDLLKFVEEITKDGKC